MAESRWPFSLLEDAFTWACKTGLIWFVGYLLRHGYLPIAWPRRKKPWSSVPRCTLKKYFIYYTGKERDLQELADGAIYAQMIAATFPALLDKNRIQLNPTCQAERALNWALLKMALTKLPFAREIAPMVKSRKYGKDDGFDFCKYFTYFYTINNGLKIGNMKFEQGPKLTEGHRIPRMIDNYGIRLNTDSIQQPHDSNAYLLITDEENEALNRKTCTIPCKQFLEMRFGVDDGSAVTEEMIGHWRAGQDKKTSGKAAGGKENEPSIWDYNQRCLPAEFVDLKPEEFLLNPLEKNLCFLPTEILARICKKLSILDFLNLSLSCRFLHWRMFTFCKCYVPHRIIVNIAELEITTRYRYFHAPMDFCAQYNKLYGLFVFQPAKVPKPFIFNLLEVELRLPYYNKRHFDKCLPLVNPLRQQALKSVIMLTYVNTDGGINYEETNDFFDEIKASSFRASGINTTCYPDRYTEIYNRCPYAQQMEDVLVHFSEEDIAPQHFPNRSGVFAKAPLASVVKTLQLIHNGNLSPEYQLYLYHKEQSDETLPNEILQYLFGNYIFEEYFSSKFSHLWTTMITKEERCYKLQIIKNICYEDEDAEWLYTAVAIGDETCFEQWENRYHYIYREDYLVNDIRWRMETAAEGGGDEELWTTVDESDDETTTDELEEKEGNDETEETSQELTI